MNVVGKPVEQLTAALRDLGVPFRPEEPLGRYTTIGLGGPAELLAFPTSTEQMFAALRQATELGIPVRVMGAGSNLLIGDRGVRGLVLHSGAMKIVRYGERGELEAEAGMHFPTLVRGAVSRGLRGLEGGVGIPGSLGGVVVMNAGAFRFSIGEWVERVTVISPSRGKLDLAQGEVDFRYRSSSLGEDLIVARAVLRLPEDDPRAIRADMERHLAVRKATQPVGVKSAGCIFKNPEGDSAGRIIDQLGLKGLRMGRVRISEVHANYIVNEGRAETADVLALIEEVKERVQRALGVEMEEEVRLWI